MEDTPRPRLHKRASLDMRQPELASMDDAEKRKAVSEHRRKGVMLNPDGSLCTAPKTWKEAQRRSSMDNLGEIYHKRVSQELNRCASHGSRRNAPAAAYPAGSDPTPAGEVAADSFALA